ncbi:hypothetical protein VXN63_02170 [Marinilactibacillus sp. XAAS-LB27]|uniref:hypothetical protein n=1 Tax=Marinilactibacillus sp. XAAS-LB27 TaxID=3114538 RepID=UPI002E18096C|nr:hypothetical protein [Marinilactibacillus sp. XAAS-LB27]
MKQIIKAHPGWSINTILETDVQYLDDIMFSTSSEDNTSNQQVQSQKVISMEDWFKEIQS